MNHITTNILFQTAIIVMINKFTRVLVLLISKINSGRSIMLVTNVIVSHPGVSYICSVNKDTEVSMADAVATVVLRCFMIRMEFIYISMAMPFNIYFIFSLIIHVRIKKHAHILTNLSKQSIFFFEGLRPRVHTN